jgi:G3E family GTPase
MSETTTRIPLTILTGFLGAGKTSLLNHLLHAEHGLRVAVMVNDFGAVNIDSQLVVGVEDEQTVNLSNGCICCSIRDDLYAAAVQLIRRPDPPEYLIIEASGVSDPAAVAQTFTTSSLAEQVQLDSILAVVDAEQYLHLEQELEVLALDQIGVADIVVLNKVDLVTTAQLDAIKTQIRYISRKSRILETTFGRVPLELVLGVGQYDLARLTERDVRDIHVHAAANEHHHEDEHDHEHDHQHHDHTLIFDTWSYQQSQPLAFKAVRQMINNLPTTIYRAKGFLYLDESPDRRGILQVVGKRVRITVGEPWGQEAPHNQLVFIATAGGLDPHELSHQLDDCVAGAIPQTNRLKAAVEWVRSAWQLAAATEA